MSEFTYLCNNFLIFYIYFSKILKNLCNTEYLPSHDHAHSFSKILSELI